MVIFAEVVGFEMRVSESQESENLGAVGDDALDRGASIDDRPRRAPLELVQEPTLREAVDRLVIENLDLNVRREPSDVKGELGPLAPRLLAGAEGLRVDDSPPGEGRSRLRLQHHARDHHGAENRPAAGFVDAEDHGRYGFPADVRLQRRGPRRENARHQAAGPGGPHPPRARNEGSERVPERALRKDKYNVVVIGAGTAGLVTAAGTAGLGGRVALIEGKKMGGDCLNFGCVPSKALISSAKLVHRIRRGPELGLSEMEPSFRFEDVFRSMRERRARIEPNDSKERFEGLGVEVFLGKAKFLSPHEVEIDGGTRLRARNFVIATGTRALVPPVAGLDRVPYYTNETFFDELARMPESMLVLGGGPIGCELAQVSRRLGIDVHIVELLPRLLPRDDSEASALIRKRLESEGIEVATGTKAVRFDHQGGRTVATVEANGAKKTLTAAAVLVAAGRTPNVESLGLESAGVKFSRRGVEVDETLTTSQPHIFACGDVAGPYAFTHAADYQARIVVRNILLPWFKAKASYRWMPWVTYTDPEVAHFGPTEEEARAKNIAYDVFRFDWDELDRAVTDSETEGFIKVLTARGKDTIVGATVVGVHAGEVMHEVLVAAKHGIGLSKLSGTVHAYPTYSSSVQRVADSFQKTRLTPRVAALFRWLYRRRRS